MDSKLKTALLMRRSGPMAGACHRLTGRVLRIGRSPDNDLVIDGAGGEIVSAHHVEIRSSDGGYRLVDLDSTNGTFLNGERVSEAMLESSAVIQLGRGGPELAFMTEDARLAPAGATVVVAPDATIVVATGATLGLPPQGAAGAGPMTSTDEALLNQAVTRARMARRAGVRNQTLTIMRGVLRDAVERTGHRWRVVVIALVCALVATAGYASWQINAMRRDKRNIDGQIQQLEALLERTDQDPMEQERIVQRLSFFEDEARALQRRALYRLSVREQEPPLAREIKALMAEFGADVYKVPPEFLEQVTRFIEQYQGTDRPHMERALGKARPQLDTMRAVLRDDHLPPDLAFMVLVESAFLSGQHSRAGAVGLWQFTPATARQYGLKITTTHDERLEAGKATRAACRYIRELILEFGAGSSVMLALAAYNVGPGKVRRAVRRVEDPIKQRDFWYLYRTHALPVETREYVPKVMAAMIIGRRPEQYGF